jgi:roadblock/LC7 domain-containing protein
MADLENLMKLDGALAAFEFNDRGELQGSKIADSNAITPEVLDLVAHVCVANGAIASMQARGWEKVTGMKGFYPLQGLSLVGFDWTIVVHGNRGVILPNSKADFDKAYAALGA